MQGDGITVIKLGGSCFSDKKVPKSLHLDVIDSICQQLVENRIPMIIVHGGGSYGHPVAKKYDIHLGLQQGRDDQAIGFCETHAAMAELNIAILQQFTAHGLPAYPVQPSAMFVMDNGVTSVVNLDAVDALLDQGLIPVLYGDPVIDKSRGFGILSGDTIIVELANKLNHHVDRIVYLMDVDGLFDKNPKVDPSAQLIPEIVVKNGALHIPKGETLLRLEDVVPRGDGTIDVTGGIYGKIRTLGQLEDKEVSSFLINGRDKVSLSRLLNDEKEVPRTRITIQ